MTPTATIHTGDALETLRTLPDRSIHMVAFSPPFYGLRDYGTGRWEGGDPDCQHESGRDNSRILVQERTATEKAFRSSRYTRQGDAPRNVCRCGARRVDGQIGLEDTLDEWVASLCAVADQCWRVLRDDGTMWVEIGDSYAGKPGGVQGSNGQRSDRTFTADHGSGIPDVLKPKDLLGQPWTLAFALRDRGWYLRSEIIWARPNPMPESVTDRPTKSHSTVFLLAKKPRYYWDADAVREPSERPELIGSRRNVGKVAQRNGEVFGARGYEGREDTYCNPAGRNARSVLTIPTEPTPWAHFATWPSKLVEWMVKAGTSERGCCPECLAPWVRVVEREVLNPGNRTTNGRERTDEMRGFDVRREVSTSTVGWRPGCDHDHDPIPCTVLDPFAGSGTTLVVARKLGRSSIGIELNPEYVRIAEGRLAQGVLL